MRAYRSGRLGVALSWSLRSKVRVVILFKGHHVGQCHCSQDAAFAASLAEKLATKI